MRADPEKTQAPGCNEDFLRRYAHKIETAGCDQTAMGAPPRPMSAEEVIAELFKYHAPTVGTLPKYAAIDQAAKNFAEVILANCPPGKDRYNAIGSIRIARMTANAAIALNGLAFAY
jgi:hypothetical protein